MIYINVLDYSDSVSFELTVTNKTTKYILQNSEMLSYINDLRLTDDVKITLPNKQEKICYKIEKSSCSYKTQPFEYQQEGINYGLSGHNKWLLLDAPGLGKTLQLTYLAQELKEKTGLQHCLIICGINTLKTNWKNEIEKHSNLTCRILGQRYTKKGTLVVDGIQERLKQLKNPIDEFFVITNVETLRDDKIVQSIIKNKYNKFDMIVIDEIHKCKSTQSQQGKNLLKLNKSKYQVGATGTLLLNNPLDAYVPLKWIGAERSNYSTFRYYYCNYGGPFGNMLMGFKNIPVLQDQIKKYSLRRTKDILNLPPKNIIHEYVDMSDAQEIFYENVKAGIAQEVDKVKLSTASVLAITTRLRQATACPSILTTETIPSAKLDRAEDLTEQIVTSGYKLVIFSTFKETVYELARRLSSHYNIVIATGDQKESEIELAKQRFQEDPSVQLFIGTWAKCGTGITLTAASYMIFIDTPWTESEFTQNCDRIHRVGTVNSVFIYNLVTRNTVDERVLELIQDKGAISDYVVDERITAQGLQSLRKYIEEII